MILSNLFISLFKINELLNRIAVDTLIKVSLRQIFAYDSGILYAKASIILILNEIRYYKK